jgi:predicted Zn-dependent peptidase
MRYQKTTLPNGVRVIVVPAHDNPSASVMIACETGSNYETKRENGLSHFLEHMLFKGTPTRPTALSVSSELDTIGAESNAFTSSEVTAYYTKAQKKHWKKLLEVVSDMYLNPAFPVADLEKERGVILQEISMYKDLPQRHVWDLLAKHLYGDTPAGRTVLGPGENIKRFTRQDFLGYHRKHYVSTKTIVAIAGDVTLKAALEEVKKIFGALPSVPKRGKEKVKEKQSAPGFAFEKRKSDQTHMVMAFRGYGAHDKRSVTAALVMGILGHGMSSRLFHRLRTEMGACYYVHSHNEVQTDYGLATISTGIEAKRAVEVTKALLDECKRLTYEKVPDKELQKAKDYMVSHMYMGLETSDSLAGFYVSEEIVHGETRNPTEIEAEIRKVTAEDIMELAKELFREEKLNLAVVGNLSDQKSLKKALTFK